MKQIPTLLILLTLASASCTQFSNPPVKTSPRKVRTGLPPTTYAAVLEKGESFNPADGRRLSGIKVIDRGYNLDCGYPEVVERARNRVMAMGGNVLIITQHELPGESNNCNRIRGEVYRVPSLEGLESKIRWHPGRPLQLGDFRRNASGGGLGQTPCEFSFRLLGDFFNEAIVRTYTIFHADSSWLPADPAQRALALRRGQVVFNMAEIQVRAAKASLAVQAANLPTLKKRAQEALAAGQAQHKVMTAALDAELAKSGNPEAVLSQWETRISSELARTDTWAPELRIDLHQKKKKD